MTIDYAQTVGERAMILDLLNFSAFKSPSAGYKTPSRRCSNIRIIVKKKASQYNKKMEKQYWLQRYEYVYLLDTRIS